MAQALLCKLPQLLLLRPLGQCSARALVGLVLLPLLLLQPTAAREEVIVIGDSTAANYTDFPHFFPRSGWAMFLQDHFNRSAVVVRDLAAAGRSSKSFYLEQRWQQIKSTYLSAGDYVFIQFGHNDQKSDAERHTDPFTSYQYYLSIYVNETRAANATPVLLTSIARAVWQSNGVFMDTLGDYIVAVRQLAKGLGVPIIDLNQKTTALFTQLGEQSTQNNLFMCLPAGKYSNYPNGIIDTTHLQVAGAKEVAKLAADGIMEAHLAIRSYLLNPTSTL